MDKRTITQFVLSITVATEMGISVHDGNNDRYGTSPPGDAIIYVRNVGGLPDICSAVLPTSMFLH